MSALMDAACRSARRHGVSVRFVRCLWGVGNVTTYRPRRDERPGRYGQPRIPKKEWKRMRVPPRVERDDELIDWG